MSLNCQKCGGSLEEGYVLDSIATQTKSETWVEGAKPHSVWANLGGDKKKSYDVSSYRCTDCGYLEFYASVEK